MMSGVVLNIFSPAAMARRAASRRPPARVAATVGAPQEAKSVIDAGSKGAPVGSPPSESLMPG